MSTVIVFYSLSGKTKAYVEQLAQERSATVIEVQEIKKRNTLTAFLPGCLQAAGQKTTHLSQKLPDLSSYDTIIIAAPIWAGYPAPAFNSIVEQLPPDKNVELIFTSSSGKSASSDAKVRKLLESKSCHIIQKQDVQTA